MENTRDIWQGRAVLHVDMDAFFASVEQLDHPEWRGRPVIVGGSAEGRGVVSTASYEARVFGIRSAMPSAQAARLCPDAVWVRGNFSRYRELSRTICEIFRAYTPTVQQVSIDEAYLDVTPTPHNPRDPVETAREIRARVDALGLSCSIGVASSKTVAKIASDHDKPHGITIVRPGDVRRSSRPCPSPRFPGWGRPPQSACTPQVSEPSATLHHSTRRLRGSFSARAVRSLSPARAASTSDRCEKSTR